MSPINCDHSTCIFFSEWIGDVSIIVSNVYLVLL